MYSAIKVNGKKLYEYARNGKEVEISQRTIKIYDIFLNEINENSNEIVFTVKCSKGTYIRSLCADIAKSLDAIGCMKELERIEVGRFNIKDAIKVDELKENKDNINFIKTHFLDFEKVLEDKPIINLKKTEIQPFLNGVKLKKSGTDGIYRVKDENAVFIGTAELKNGLLKRDIII